MHVLNSAQGTKLSPVLGLQLPHHCPGHGVLLFDSTYWLQDLITRGEEDRKKRGNPSRQLGVLILGPNQVLRLRPTQTFFYQWALSF